MLSASELRRAVAGRVLWEGLLELARGDAPLNLVNVELGAAALSSAKSQREAFVAAGKRLELDVEESWVRAEMPGVQQVVQNLLENALKYGGSRVRVRVSGSVLEIEDSGPGPNQEPWGRVLRPFERGGRFRRCRATAWGWPWFRSWPGAGTRSFTRSGVPGGFR